MIKTEFYNDFLAYYDKAKILQDRNSGLTLKAYSGDPLMDNITIYDTVNRKYAGFGKALEDLHGVRCENHHVKYRNYDHVLGIYEFHFIHLFHRFTGSGASFRPTFDDNGNRRDDEHGYHNNHAEAIAECLASGGIIDAKNYIVNCTKPMVTSIGNQPPSLKNSQPEKYRLAMQYYFDNFAYAFITAYVDQMIFWKKTRGEATGIKEAVDFCCKWHKDKGFKQWHFVLTAFVMDTAEYYSDLVNPSSHCYYGANCIRGFKMMFQKDTFDKKIKNKDWYELCMADLVHQRPNSKPYDMEDVVCDYIRYVVQYFPKGYEQLTKEESSNDSTLKVNGKYPNEIKKIITKHVGYYDYRTKAVLE